MDTFADSLNSITDPSDWLKTEYPNLSGLDSLLRCHICKEIIKAPVLTSCDHIFCSVCIRRSLAGSKKCPLCLEETYESKLRKVLLLDEIAIWFSKNRAHLLEKFQPIIKQRTGSDEEDSQDVIEIESDSNSSSTEPSSQRLRPKRRSSKLEPLTRPSQKKQRIQPQRTIPTELVECPICSDFMTAKELQETHIDKCLSREETGDTKQDQTKQKKDTNTGTLSSFFKKSKPNKSSSSSPAPVALLNTNHQQQPEAIKRNSRLSSFDPTMTTPKLKNLLSSMKISIQGTRHQLEMRFKEYINLYNANLDSMSPVADKVLISRLSKWESLSNGKPTNPNANADKKIESKEWRKKYKSDYDDLIEKARANMKKSKNDVTENGAKDGPERKTSDGRGLFIPSDDDQEYDSEKPISENIPGKTSLFVEDVIDSASDAIVEATKSSEEQEQEQIESVSLFVGEEDDEEKDKYDPFEDDDDEEILSL